LGTFGGATSGANGMNASGIVVGWASTAGGSYHAFVYNPSTSTMTDLHPLLNFGGPESSALAVNSAGKVVGYAETDSLGTTHAFQYDINTGTVTDLHATVSLGGVSSDAFDINDAGQITGAATMANGTRHGYVYNPLTTTTTDLGFLGGTGTFPYAINASGQVAGGAWVDTGNSVNHAFRTAALAAINPTTDNLGTLGGTNSLAEAINTSGWVVGRSDVTTDAIPHAFVYDPAHGMRDLNTLLPANSGWVLQDATGINDTGQISGWGYINGQQHAFLLAPLSMLSSAAFYPSTASFSTLANSGSTQLMVLPSGAPWAAVVSDSWLNIDSVTSGFGDTDVSYRFAANAGPARTATITVGSAVFTITQGGNVAPSAFFIPPGVVVGSASTTGSTSMYISPAGATWTAASSADWLTITSSTSGQGDATISYSVAANTGASSRSATITVCSAVFTITQGGNVATSAFFIPPGASVGSASTTGSTSMHISPAGATWTAASSADWLTITSSTSGQGDATISYSVAANTSASSRSATITVAGVVFTVTQSGVSLVISSPANLGTWPLGEDQAPLTATGGNGSYTWAYVSGTLPPGLSLRTDVPSFFPTGATAGLIGVATTPGNYTFTLSVTSGTNTVPQTFSMRITGLTLKDPFNLPDAFVNSAYSYQLTAINSTGSPVTVTWTATSGIPAGMTLYSSGLLSGAPTAAGSYNINFYFTDGTDTVYRGVSLNVSAVQITSPGLLPNATQNASYNYALAASGGTGPYTYAMTGGSPPNGLSLNSGVISGTVNAGQGKNNFSVTVTDSQNHSYTKSMAIDAVSTPEGMPQIWPYGNLDDFTIGQGSSRGIGVYNGGAAPFTWSVTGLPPGMDFRTGSGTTLNWVNPGDLELWGTPTALGAYNVSVTATDTNGLSVTQVFPFKVSALALDTGLSGGTVGVPYSSTFRIVGGTPSYTAAQVPTRGVPGTLPAGTSLAGLAVTGTPLEGGGFQPLFLFTDSAGNTLTISQYPYFNGVAGTSTSVNYFSTQYATLNQPYSFQFGACCAASYIWTQISGSLPTGLTLSSGGVLSGTPGTAGTYTFLVQATQTGVPSNYGTRQMTIVVTPLVVTTGFTLPYGNVNVSYSQTLTATGGTGSLTWSLAAGNLLPPGLSLNGATGVIGGMPSATGQYSFNVNVSDSGGHSAAGYFNMAVYATGGGPPLSITTSANLGTSSMGEIQDWLLAGGGNGTYTWSLTGGTLPSGLALRTDTPSWFPSNASAGLIGVATTPGTYSFTLQVASGTQSVSQTSTMKITGLNLKDFSPLPDAFVGSAYMTTGYQLTAINGSGSPVAVTWTYISGIPAGMTLSPSGLLSGTPTAAGSYNINFSYSDGTDTVSRSVGLTVWAVQITSPGLLPSATLNSAYPGYTLTASGGTGPYTFAIVGGGLPNGMTLNSGVVSGTPTNTGQGRYAISVTARDHNGLSYTKNMAIYVLGTPENMPLLNPYGNLDDCTIGQGCSRAIYGYGGGTPPFTWTATNLPPGMDFRTGSGTTQSNVTANDLELWGTPTSLGTYNVTITATDANNLSTTQVFPLKVSALWLDTGLPSGTVGVYYSGPLRIVGGVPTYTAVVVPTTNFSGTLPAGTSLSGLTVSGTPTESGGFNPLFLFTDSASTAHTLTLAQYPYISGVAGTSTNVNFYNTQYATLNQPYSLLLGACCAASYVWTQISGSLPTGTTLSSGGVLSGTPTTAGTYTFLVQATQTGVPSNYGTRQITIVVTPLVVTTGSTLPYGNVNVSYSQTLTATGGTGSLTWSLGAGQFLPPGLSLDGATGVISGKPSATGQYFFNVNVSDSASHSAVGYFNMAVYATGGGPPLFITSSANLGTWSIGEIQTSLVASGGNGTYTWSVATGSTLPPGLALRTDTPSWFSSNASAGLMGVATTPGTYSFTLQVTSGTQSFSQAFTMKITGLVGKENACYQLPDAFVGQSYSYSLSALNNAGAVTWTATSNVPAGMTLANGVLSGPPTQAGYYNINYTINDGVDTVNVCSSLNVSLVQVTSPGVLPNATQNYFYSYTVAASGGTLPYTFSVSALPSGLALNSSTGLISGTVTQGAIRFSFNLTATDKNNFSYTKTMALAVIGGPPVLPSLFTYSNFDDCTIGMACERQIGVGGGAAPFTWNVTGLPSGMSFRTGSGNMPNRVGATDVELYGVPLATGTYNVQATVTDNTGATATEAFPLTVSTLFIDGSDNLPNGTRGVAYSKLLRVLGGSTSPAYTAQIARGVLPDGLGLSLNGMKVSGTPLENGSFGPDFTFTETGSGSTLHLTEYFSIGGGTSTISLNQYYFDSPGSTTDIIGYYTVGSTLSYQLNACCAPPYTWSQTGGLPPGITLNTTSGLLSGTFTTAGTYSFLVQAANGTNTGALQYTIVVTLLNITTSSSLPHGNVGASYSVTLSSNMTPTTFTLVPGYYLPPGLNLETSGWIHGTPTATGQYSFYVQATDSSEVFIEQFNISIYANGVSSLLFLGTGPNLGTFSLGAHNFQLTASGGKPPYHYSLTPGAGTVPGYRVQDGTPLPQSFSLSGGTGGFIGVLATPGTWNTSLRVTDATGTTFDRPVSITATSLNILTPGAPPNATQNSSYSFTFTGYGGTGTYTWSATNLPNGLSMNSATGTISSGTGTVTGSTSTATITITDSTPVSVSFGYTINVDPFAITLNGVTTNGVLPQGAIGIAYSQTLSASGCGSNCTWSIPSGSLPSGLSFNSSTGAIAGTPTGYSNSTFTVQASGSNGKVQKRFSLLIPFNTLPPPLFITTTSPIGYTTVGNTFNLSLSAQGGVPPYTWSVAPGSTLPPGLSLQTPGETIGSLYNPGFTYLAGRVMQAGSGPGASFTFTLQVTDHFNNWATQTFTFIAPLMSLNVGTWPISNPGTGTYATTYSQLIYNTSYTQAQVAQGGSGNYTSWTTPLAGNPMPPGLSLDQHTGVISGTPANTGSFSTLIEVDDDTGNALQQFVNFNIAPSTVSIGLGPSLGTVASGGSSIFNINPSGGTGPYTITALSALPPGCALETGNALLSNGTGSYDLACSFLAAGSFSFTLQAQDSATPANIGVKTMNINVAPFQLYTTTSLANGSVGTSYSQQLLAWDNAGTVSWSIGPYSAFPPGMGLCGSALCGTPTAAGSYSFVLTASDSSSGFSINYTFSLFISTITISGPGITPPGILTQEATIGVPFSYTFTATGGKSSITWTASGLPSGLSIGSSTGTISGTPSASAGLFRFTVTATDGASPVTQAFTLFLNSATPPPLNFTESSTLLPDARVGASVAYTLTPSGGTPPYSWSIASGSTLPDALGLYSGTSLPPNVTYGTTILAGEPTTAGTYTFDLIVQDSTGERVRRTFSLNVTPIAIVSGSLKGVTAGVAYSQQLTVVGGTAPYTFSYAPTGINTPMFPPGTPGITASSSGLISGTTTSTGSYSFYATATDQAGHTYTTSYTLTVTTSNGIQITTAQPFGLSAGVGYSASLTASGATSPLTWSISSGMLPAGLSLSGSTISGAPSAPGPYTYTVHLVDNAGHAADRTYGGTVLPMQLNQLRINWYDLPPAVQGQPYTYTYSVAGGTAPYTFVESPLYPLPPGMTLSSSGVLSGTPRFNGTFQLYFTLSDATYSANANGGSLAVPPASNLNPPTVTSSSNFGFAFVGTPFLRNLDCCVEEGVPPYTWSMTGSVPGLSVVAGNGSVPSFLAGIPTTAGTFPLTLTGTDSVGQTASYSLTISVGSLSMTPAALLPNGMVGTSYSTQLNPAGGTPPYTFSLVTGSDMPAGLSLSSSGLISGTPTYPGYFVVGVVLTDSGGKQTSPAYRIVIDNPAGQAPGISINADSVQLSYAEGQPALSVPITVNMTSGGLSFNAAVNGIPGASLSATTVTSSSSSATLLLNVNTASLAPGTYAGVLAVSAPNAVNLWSAVPVTLTVTVGPQAITFGALADQTYGASPFLVSATASSGLPVTFTASGNCTVAGSTVSITGAGSCSITANQTGNANYMAASPVIQTFAIAKATLTVTADNKPSTYGSALPALTGSIVGLVNGDNVTATFTTTATPTSPAGTYPITPVLSDPNSRLGNYSVTIINGTLTVTVGSQTIAFGTLSNQTYGTTPTVSATASSGLAVSFASTTPAVCTVSGAAVTLVSVGTCTIQATQAGNTNWAVATPVNESFQVTPGSQTVTFGALSNHRYGDAPFTVGATASSGLTVTFTASGNCAVTGSTVSITGAGSCSITANQAGNADYVAASPVIQTFAIAKATLTVTAANASRYYGAPNPPLTGSIVGLVDGDNITATFTTTATITSPPGIYPITPVLIDPNSRLGNYVITYSGTLTVIAAPIISLSGTALSFGGQDLGASATMTLTVSNVGTADLTIASASVGGANDGDFAIANNCGTAVPAGGSCTIAVTFTPQALGARTGSLTLTDNTGSFPGSQQVVSLTGSGILRYGVYATGTGCGAITLSGNASTDSYDSTIAGGYAASKANSQGDLAVNGNAALNGNVVVNGAIYAPNPAVGACKNGSPGITISGKALAKDGYLQLANAIGFATPGPVVAGNSDIKATANMSLAPGNYHDVVASGKTVLTLAPGTYNLNSITLTGGAKVAISPAGPVVLNIAGANKATPVDLSGGSMADPAGIPANFTIIYAGTAQLSLAGQDAAYGVVYAPNAEASLSGQADWFGALVVKTLVDSGGAAVHYDRSLGH
jgi:probable HAF family extracellular repeat protein